MKNFLVTFLLFFLVLYHGANLHTKSTWGLFRSQATHNGPKYLDWATRSISGLGYALRYLAGQDSPLLFRVKNSTPLELELREEVKFETPATRPQLRARAQIYRETIEYYRGKGVEVVFLPIPSKLSFGNLPTLPAVDPWRSEGKEERVSLYSDLLKADSQSIDLERSFKKHLRTHSQERVFLPHDYHWTSLGITLSAQAVLHELGRRGWTIPTTTITFSGWNPNLHEGRLLDHYLLPDWFLAARQEFRWREPFYELRPKRLQARGRLIVVGTSFSGLHKGTPQGLGTQLASVLGRELIEANVDGGRDVGGFERLAREGFEFHPGDLLIWEMPLVTSLGLGRPIPRRPVTNHTPLG